MFLDESMETLKPIPQRRIIEKMNEYMSRRDYRGAERHLLYWLEEAELGRDLQGQLMLRNEMVGHYRKTGERDKAMESAQKALDLLSGLGMEDSISAGTTYVNIATAYNAFGEFERSLELFEKAKNVYEGSRFVEPQLLGGLYNNMALTCAALKRYEGALELYEKALGVMGGVPDGELEQAITYLNMANTVEAQMGMEEGESRVYELVDKAEELLMKKGEELVQPPSGGVGVRNGDRPLSGKERACVEEQPLSGEDRARIGYYAFVCEKCAPTFEYYGYFLTAESLRETAEKIYSEEM